MSREWSTRSVRILRLEDPIQSLAVAMQRSGRSIALGVYHPAVLLASGRIVFVGEDMLHAPVSVACGDACPYLAYSREAQLLAVGGGPNHTIRLIDVESLSAIRFTRHQWGGTGAVAFSPTADLLYLGQGKNEVRILDAKVWQEVRRLKVRVGVVLSLAVSPDGRVLAVGGGGGEINIIDLSTAALMGDMHGHRVSGFERELLPGVRQVAFSRDGRCLASAGTDGKLCLWDLAEHRELQAFRVPGGLWSAAFSPDGELLVSGGTDGAVRLWHIASGQHRYLLVKHDRPVTGVAFVSDEAICSTSLDRCLKLVTPEEPTQREGEHTWLCFHCGAELAPAAHFCASCGKGAEHYRETTWSPDSGVWLCSKCGAQFPASASFCPSCGLPVEPTR